MFRRDENGVAHVRAAGPRELWRGMGRAHATDRGMQMLLTRILGRGHASRELGATDELFEVDRFFRRMRWYGNDERALAALRGEDRALIQAYCDGVNDVFARDVPWELRLLRVRKPDAWTIRDCLLMSRITGYVTLAQTQADMERLIVEMIQAGLGREELDELFPNVVGELDEGLIREVKLSTRIVPESIVWRSLVPRMAASNNWVLAGEKTVSGLPLFANDPHLEVNRLPAVWYEIVLEREDGEFVAGASLPGCPGVVLGRNRRLAWGATYAYADPADSWSEECEGGRYRREDEWHELAARAEVIERKGKPPVTLTFHDNEHGTLDGDPAVRGHYLATRWAANEAGAQTLALLLSLFDAASVDDGIERFGTFEYAANWVFADRDGNIGYRMSGLIPRRRSGLTGLVPVPGWKRANDWLGLVDPSDLPQAKNPKEGFLVTANNDLNHLGRAKPINLPMGPYRARRIEQVLRERPKHTVSDMFTPQNDLYSTQADEFLPVVRPYLPDTAMGRALRDWDRRYDVESKGAHAFEIFYRTLFREVFGAALGRDVARHLDSETGVFADFYANFDRVLLSERSVWFGDESRDAIYARVAASSLTDDVRTWGTRQGLTFSHLLFGGKLPRALGFDRGPVRVPGGRATVHQGQIYRSGGRVTSFLPSWRAVADLSSNAMWTCLAGGPSDRRFSRWYCSDLERWQSGRYKRLVRS